MSKHKLSDMRRQNVMVIGVIAIVVGMTQAFSSNHSLMQSFLNALIVGAVTFAWAYFVQKWGK